MGDYVTEVNDANFESEVLESSQPVLVEFWAEWCQPCKVLAPTVESLAEKYEHRLKVVKLNVDEGAGSSSRFGIKAIPTLILFRDGKEVQRIVGVPTNAKEFISQMLDKQLPKNADAAA
jgi:thioredoxin 1